MRLSILLAATVISLAAPLLAETGGKKLVQVTNTQQVPFAAGGTIHLTNSYGYLSIEGWDQPQVEITVTRSLADLYDAKDQAEANKRVETVKVAADRHSDSDLEITTTVPHYSRWTHPFGSTGGVEMECRIHVPRNSKLVIHHGNGDVLVSNVVGDIEANGHAGDIVLLLPATEKYAIDARSKIGTVLSDFDGDPRRHDLVGERYALDGAAPAHKIYLRMGVGGITIKESPPSAQAPASGPSRP